jgi:nucleotide-binding universal stress UspA family protein
MKILVAYDGSRPADAAIDRVLERPWPAGTAVRLVMVIEWPLLMLPADGLEVADPLTDQVREVQRKDAHERLEEVRRKFEVRSDLTIDWELREGSAKHALLDAIDEWKPDLVFVGSHGKKAMSRVILGSVSHALVTHAPCSVEIVKLPSAL